MRDSNLSDPSPVSARIVVSLVLALAVLVLGCGAGGPKLVPVRGKVTLGGGPWPKPGALNFVPAGTGGRPGTADFDTEGNFTATSFNPGDGLMPGKYKVSVTCWAVPMDMRNPAAGKSAVPGKYMSADTSGFEITVESGKPQTDLKYDVPKP